MNELLLRFCWSEINPQLVAAAKQLSVDFVKEAYDLIDNHFEAFAEENQRQYRQRLRETVHERFTRLASWFRQPEDGFVSATIRQLGDLILLEAQDADRTEDRLIEWSGDAVDVEIDGLSVHRMYDCLFVLLRNAFKYGAIELPIKVSIVQEALHHESFARVRVSVSSNFRNADEQEVHSERLAERFASDDPGAAMTVEGYSGVRKLRYITNTNEGVATAKFRILADVCTVSFALTLELAKQGSPDESLAS